MNRSLPPLLMGVTLLFWGWQAGLLILAGGMAILVEAPRLTAVRFEFSDHHLSRVSDLCALILLFAAIYFMTTQPSRSITKLSASLPLVLFPLFAIQQYNSRTTVDLKVLFLMLRRKSPDQPTRAVDLTYPYFVVCMIAAGAANYRTYWFYLGMLLLCTWVLWPLKPRHAPRSIWLTAILISGLLGFAGQMGLNHLQKTLMDWTTNWFYAYLNQDRNPYKTKTAMGDIGALKASSKIIFRVKAGPNVKIPLLLSDAVYNTYVSSFWSAIPRRFENLPAGPQPGVWLLGVPTTHSAEIGVAAYLQNGKGLLKIPNGTFQVDHLAVARVEGNPLGTLQVSGGPGVATYHVRFDMHNRSSGDVIEQDLQVPPKEAAAVLALAQELNLQSLTGPDVIARLTQYFASHFRYSLQLTRVPEGSTALADFLTRSRAGHCEYFATATVLLLRAAGIPARYVTGFAVHEKGSFDDWLVVRERHAHAWALAYINGYWIDVDTTPPAWMTLEDQQAPFWEPLRDGSSYLYFLLSEWFQQSTPNQIFSYLALPGLILILVLYKKKARPTTSQPLKRRDRLRGGRKPRATPDSVLGVIERKLEPIAPRREPWEPLTLWISRIEDALPSEIPLDLLRQTLALYYCERFDPQGLTRSQSKQLTANIQRIAAL